MHKKNTQTYNNLLSTGKSNSPFKHFETFSLRLRRGTATATDAPECYAQKERHP
jgi:hypothetical protein